MKLLFIIVRDAECDRMTQTLIEGGYRVTRVASTGGFLRKGNVTLMCGVEDDKVKSVIERLREVAGPQDGSVHRATIFVVNMPYFEQI